jgi:hypothetical protein
MTNPYEPPGTTVQDAGPQPTPGWLRLVASIIVASLLALALAWIVAPWLVGVLLGRPADASVPTSFLLCDMALSFIAFCVGALLAAKLAGARPYVAALGVSFIGWLVYFIEVGGLPGMLHSVYPFWYDFAPVHLIAGLLAGAIWTRRSRRQPVLSGSK